MKGNPRILVVDDEMAMREALRDWLMEDGYEVGLAGSGEEAITLASEETWDIMLLDLKMPGLDGIETLKKVKEINPEIEIIMMTAYATIDTAVKAMKEGAFDYLVKPFDPDEIQIQINKILERKELKIENLILRQRLEEKYEYDEIIGISQPMKEIFELISKVSKSDSNILITGESGTGKELIARAIHANSERCFMPFIVINCGALPDSLLESELFGYEKGAFTGAEHAKKGRIEMADKGTLFLDEIGDISPKTQLGLLRVIQQKEITKLGSEKIINVDVRIISATNRDLKEAVKEGRFREDLYWRLNVINIHVPPLRERKEDIPLLADFFIKRFAVDMKKEPKRLSQEAIKLLMDYDWPGNVRELENVIERAMVIGKGDVIRPEDLPFKSKELNRDNAPKSLKMVERLHIERILKETNWNITKASRILEIDRQTLYNKIKKYGIKKEKGN